MEFLLVVYPTEREVVIDGVEAGLTNHLVTLPPGTYQISLAGPDDYVPAHHVVVVVETSPLDPCEVVFA